MKNSEIHAYAYDIIETLENAYFDRDGMKRGHPRQLFNLSDVRLVEQKLHDFFESVSYGAEDGQVFDCFLKNVKR